MAFIEWSDKLSVHIKEFDDQHKNLVATINKLYEAMKHGEGKTVLNDVLSELVDYTQYHFQTEEKRFQQYNFSEGPKHTDEHNALMKKVHDLQKKHKEGTFLLSIEVLEFLKNWITHHIRVVDKQYSEYLRSQGMR